MPTEQELSLLNELADPLVVGLAVLGGFVAGMGLAAVHQMWAYQATRRHVMLAVALLIWVGTLFYAARLVALIGDPLLFRALGVYVLWVVFSFAMGGGMTAMFWLVRRRIDGS